MYQILHGDALLKLAEVESESVQTCVTSPPYWGLRNYGVDGQLGLEKTPEEYVGKLVEIFREVRRVLRKDGTLWLNLGDSYAGGGFCGSENALAGKQGTNRGSRNMIGRPLKHGLKPKDLIGIPWRAALALQSDGWYLRSDIIWSKSNPMPESITDRPTKSHEYIFLLARSRAYYYDYAAIKEPAVNGKEKWRNKRSVWNVTAQPYREAHFATFPPDLIKPCILAGAPVGGVVLDPFTGSGTTGKVAIELGRSAILIELKAEYISMIKRRCSTAMAYQGSLSF